MPTIFSNSPGEAVAVVADNDIPLSLSLDGFGGFLSTASILTDISVGLDGNAQCRASLENITYIYVFGDKISLMQVSGLAFAGRCGERENGLEQVLAYYDANKVANRETPLLIQIGVSASGLFRGALVGMRANARAMSRVSEFSLSIATFPRSNPRFYAAGTAKPTTPSTKQPATPAPSTGPSAGPIRAN